MKQTYATTQLTSKKLKVHQIIAGTIMVVGMASFFAGMASVNDVLFYGGLIVAGIGVVWGAVTSVVIWWHHS